MSVISCRMLMCISHLLFWSFFFFALRHENTRPIPVICGVPRGAQESMCEHIAPSLLEAVVAAPRWCGGPRVTTNNTHRWPRGVAGRVTGDQFVSRESLACQWRRLSDDPLLPRDRRRQIGTASPEKSCSVGRPCMRRGYQHAWNWP